MIYDCIESITAEIRVSYSIEEAARATLSIANAINHPVLFEFNGIKLAVRPNDTIKGIVEAYYNEIPSVTHKGGKTMNAN